MLILASFVGGITSKVLVQKAAVSLGFISSNSGVIDSNLGLFLALFSFTACLFTLLVLFKPLHHRSYKTLITGANSIRWGRFFFAALIWAFLLGITFLGDYLLNPTIFTFNFNAGLFIVLSIISITLIPFQTSYEEVLMRGYFAQGIGVLTKNRLLVIVIPSVVFGLLHSSNPEVSEFGFWIMMPQYILFGLMFGLISVLDDGIELAMGAHAANNIFLSIILTSNGSVFQTASLFVQQNANPTKDLFLLILMVVFFVALLSYKYKWDYRILKQKIVPASL